MRDHSATILKGGHVLDPAQDIDRIADVALRDGKIVAVGDDLAPNGSEVVDVSGLYVSPGWIDIHVHAYGTLGFADPDSIGIYQGVTTAVEAGGPGIQTFDEFMAMMSGRVRTRLYTGLYIRPIGILGIGSVEDDIRNWMDIPIDQWVDCVTQNRDTVRYLKMASFDKYGSGPLKIGKGLAEVVGLPLYVHIGEFAGKMGIAPSYHIFDVAGAGDFVTHIYHGNFGGILDADGRVVAEVRAAERRGVLFDIGFGGSNFSWDVAEKAFAQELVPHTISSDLQQFNVIAPTHSLANVLSVFLRLGLSLREVIERVTVNPARALGLVDRGGSLRAGMPADLTVFALEEGRFQLADCHSASREASLRLVPKMAFQSGTRIDSDMERCNDEANWFIMIAEDHVPAAADRLSAEARELLGLLAERLSAIEWGPYVSSRPDLLKVRELHNAFRATIRDTGQDLKTALDAVYNSFLDQPFAIQMGMFLVRLDRAFAIERLRTIARGPATSGLHIPLGASST